MAESTVPHKPLTVEEYLEFEGGSVLRHEYVGGAIYALAGSTGRHDIIATNILTLLWNAARGGPCRVHTSDRRLRAAADVFYYPDVMVVCPPENEETGDEALFEDAPCLVGGGHLA